MEFLAVALLVLVAIVCIWIIVVPYRMVVASEVQTWAIDPKVDLWEVLPPVSQMIFGHLNIWTVNGWKRWLSEQGVKVDI